MAKRKGTRRRTHVTGAPRVRPVPAGYHTVTPYVTVSDGAAALESYTRAFGARETRRAANAMGQGA